MPVEMEKRLRQEALKRRIKNKGAYIYGTMRKVGWKPSREVPSGGYNKHS